MILYNLLRKIKHKVVPILGRKPGLTLKPKGEIRGRVLLSFLTAPFLAKAEHEFTNTHANQWECWKIANTFVERGYAVDVIEWGDRLFVPQNDYAFFIDIHSNMERLSPILNPDCVKILHITGAHWLFQNKAEYSRMLDLQARRKLTLKPRRFSPPSLAIENADYATCAGSEFTFNTFNYAKKSIHQIPMSTTVMYPWQDDKDYESCKKRFLWLGSFGMVHKGLDLVLEAFAQMPEYHLTVCGPVKNEEDFEEAYYQELYQFPNIRCMGTVDVSSQEFITLTNNCLGLIFPSCSEGQSGSVITCLHAGLIPIVSYESGIDISDFGVLLNKSSIEEIKHAIQNISNLPFEVLKEKSRNAWEFARANHTRQKFAEEYEKFVVNVLGA